MAKSYQNKLKDRKWQIKRLKVFERDNFKCQLCETEADSEDDSEVESLHCHHKYYIRADPWDYPNEALITYCDRCHTNIEVVLRSIRNLNWPLRSDQMSDYCHLIILVGEIIMQEKTLVKDLIKKLTEIKNV